MNINNNLKCRFFAVYQNSIGYILIEHNSIAVTKIDILTSTPIEFGKATELTDSVYNEICEYLIGTRTQFSFAIDISGCTPFQISVLTQLQKIPYGKTCSYKDIAIAIGNPKASRAVGAANSKNPILIAIPCHRVISTNGSLNGYAGGVKAKKMLLDIESPFSGSTN